MYRYQQLEQLMTNVTFSYPDFTIDSRAPPIPIESTAHTLTQGTTRHWFDVSLNTFINTLQDLGTGVTGSDSIDGFIQALVWGKDGIPIDQLYNNGNISTITSAANKLYQQYIAQVSSANMRTTTPPMGLDLPTRNAMLSQPSQRLQQNRRPKIALQVMLAFMVGCAVAAYLVTDTKKVLPHNPCLIAGTMSLLADSEICNMQKVIPDGSEWKNNKDLKHEACSRVGILVWDGGERIRD